MTGCNVENASYGLTMCAERVALLKALSDGHREFMMVAVVADTADPTPPCGPCRQLLWEYCGDIPVVLANLDSIKATPPTRATCCRFRSTEDCCSTVRAAAGGLQAAGRAAG